MDPRDDRRSRFVVRATVMADRRAALARAVREFTRKSGTDSAATMTYYAVLTFFPVTIAVTSLLSLVLQDATVSDYLLGAFKNIAPSSVVTAFIEPLSSHARGGLAGFALVVGVVGALWSTSGYVAAFGRTMNRIYGVEEGRTFVKIVLGRLAVAMLIIILIVLMALIFVVSTPLGLWFETALGMAEPGLLPWRLFSIPLIIVLAMMIVSALYNQASNLRMRFRLVTPGSGVAVLLWMVATVAFFLYVSNFANYDAIYGSLAGVIVFLLWLFIGNVAIVLGLHLDQEQIRIRQLTEGIQAEHAVEVDVRATRGIERAKARLARDEIASRKIRTRTSE